MLFNYHTHTTRCNHATGTDREYVEAAIKNGVKTLGFSDHSPHLFGRVGYSSWWRIQPDFLWDYADSIRALAKEYANDIRILCGFEMEYYPRYFEETLDFIAQVDYDYLILGQHFLSNEIDDGRSVSAMTDEALLSKYVSQALEGLKTGKFLYFAHPDLPGVHFPEKVWKKEYTRLCKGAKALNVPLELNLLGLQTNRRYPSEDFFRIAAEVGNEVILGRDAHDPKAFFDVETEKRALEMVQRLGLKLITKPIL